MTSPRCPFCGAAAELVTGAVLYPRRADLANVQAWVCRPCDARVGCHRDTDEPKGSLADAATRHARQRAHDAFDPLWRNTRWSRRAAYKWLAHRMGISSDDCHIGQFNVAQCRQVEALCTPFTGPFSPVPEEPTP